MSADDPDLSILTRARSTGTDGAPRGASDLPLPRTRWMTRYLIPGGLITLAAGLLLYTGSDALRSAIPVHVMPTMLRTGAGSVSIVQAPGWVEADPYPTAVSALTDGIVREVLVLEGQEVKAGQVVARLVDDDARLALQKVQAELDERQATVRFAEASLHAARQHWDNPVELQRKLSTAEASLREKEAELLRWPADLAAAEARSRELEAECDRLSRLRTDEQASEIEQIRAKQQCAAQQAILESTRARKPVLEAQVESFRAEVLAAGDNLRLRIAERKAVDEAKAELDRARAALARAVAARDEARLRLERMEVRSPVAGVVMSRLVQPGSKVMMNTDAPASAQIVRLYDPGRLQVRVDVPLAEAAKLSIGQSAEIVVNALADTVFTGRITRIVHEADIQKNTLQVKVAVDSPRPPVVPEMLARVRIQCETAASQPGRQGVFVHESLIATEADGKRRVWRLDAERNLAARQEVVIGEGRFQKWVEIVEGLNPGDRLIADPPAGLASGDRVKVVGEVSLDP